jgi:excisionase family DNA binding protein
MALLTTAGVAVRLGISIRRVRELITEGRLPAQKLGRDYVINDRDLRLVGNRKPGRPRKSASKRNE